MCVSEIMCDILFPFRLNRANLKEKHILNGEFVHSCMKWAQMMTIFLEKIKYSIIYQKFLKIIHKFTLINVIS